MNANAHRSPELTSVRNLPAPVALVDAYDAALQPWRRRFATSEPVLDVLARCDLTRLAAFTTRYLAVQDSIEGLISTFRGAAAGRCVTSGHVVIGHAMGRYARATRAEVRTGALRQWGEATRRYLDLHATAAMGEQPWTMLAIGHELERLAYGWGWPWVYRVRDQLGEAEASRLEHTIAGLDLDTDHIAIGRRLIARFLMRAPDALLELVAAGTETLDVFAAVLAECLAKG